MLDHNSPEIQAFLQAWHENGRKAFGQAYKRLVYDRDAPKSAKTRKKYIALDDGSSGVFLVDRATRDVFTIKAYGVPNYKIGSLTKLTDWFASGGRP